MRTTPAHFRVQDTIRADTNEELHVTDDRGVLVTQLAAERLIASATGRNYADIQAILHRTTPGQRIQIDSVVAEREWTEKPLPPVLTATIDGASYDYNTAIRRIVSATGIEPNLVRADLLHAAAIGQDSLVFEPDTNPDLYRPQAIEVTTIVNTREKAAQSAA